MSVFPSGVHCDPELSSLPLPVRLCLQKKAWTAAPNGTTCVLTFDALGLSNIPANKALLSSFKESFAKLPGEVLDPYGAVGFYKKNTPKSEHSLAQQCIMFVQEAVDLEVPAATDKLIADVWVHQNGKDFFVFGDAAINAPTVMKSLLDNVVARFWQGVPTLLTMTYLLLWSCVTDFGALITLINLITLNTLINLITLTGAMQAYLDSASASLAIVVLCFEGPAVLMDCIVARNALVAEIVFNAPTRCSSLEAAEWLITAVGSITTRKMRDVCKPVVVEKNTLLRVQEQPVM